MAKSHKSVIKDNLRLLMNLARHDVNSPEDFWNRSINHRIIGTFLMCAHFKILHEVNPKVYSEKDTHVRLEDIYTACNTHKLIVDRILDVGIRSDFIGATKNTGLYATEKTIRYGNSIHKARIKIAEGNDSEELPNG